MANKKVEPEVEAEEEKEHEPLSAVDEMNFLGRLVSLCEQLEGERMSLADRDYSAFERCDAYLNHRYGFFNS